MPALLFCMAYPRPSVAASVPTVAARAVARAGLSARSDSAITSMHMAAAIVLDSPRVAGEPEVSAGAEIEANSAAKVGAR